MVAPVLTENREPGAIEDEPFDVVRANSSLDDGAKGTSPSQIRALNRRAAARANYESADLPSLSRSDGSTVDVSSTKDASTVTGGLSGRTRPMSPPSRAGLDDPEVYLKKDETDPSLARESSYRNEMPMDERQEYEEEMKALALCDIGEGSQGMPEFCDTALQAVNEMCAGGLTGTTPQSTNAVKMAKAKVGDKQRPNLNLKLGEKHSPSASGIEEQTAIEVEYVEPLYRGKDDYGSPKRKSALMKAMSRKAKDDWKTKGGRRIKPNENVVEAALNELAEQPNENVYATFTNAEKRKFLQLINGGNSPFEATSRVLKDRTEASTDQSSVAESSFQSAEAKSPPRTPGSRGKSRNKLAFWKRGKSKGEEPAPESAPSTPGRVLDEEEDAPEKSTEEIYEDDNSTSSCEKVGDEIKQFLKEEAESVKSEEPGFQKSGISYYDAVRKDRSLEEDDDYYNDGQYPEDSKRGNRKLKLPKGFGGFSKYKKGQPVPGEEGVESQRAILSPQTAYDEEKKAESPQDTPKSPEEIVDDLNMDAYMGSARINNSGSFDASSVATGKSYKTAGTNFTSQSTRSRRRGQAKVRLECERSILSTSMESNKTRGWQESIEAAAAHAGKVWDPETGWRDYVDPKQLDNSTDGFYSQSVDVTELRKNDTDDSARPTSPTQLPLWKETAKQPPAEVQKPPTTPSRGSKSPGRSRKSPKRGGGSSVASEEQARGWAATMKAATAKLNLQGKKWDPEKGWTGLTEEEARSVNEAMRQQDNDIAITASNDMQDFGTLNKLDEIASKQDRSMQFLSEEEEAEANGEVESTVNDDQSSSALSTSNRQSGNYIQIAATGSVQEFQRGGKSRPVIVRKQDLDQDDADYFPEGSSSHQPKGPIDLDDLYDQEKSSSPSLRGKKETKVVSGGSANKVYQKIYESQGNGSFDDGQDFSWDADEATEAMGNTDTRNAVPRLKIKIRDSAKNSKASSEASFESIPRLAAPKRDTSPIRSSKSKESPQAMSPAQIAMSPSQDDQNIFRDPQEEDIVEKELSEPIPLPVKETIGSMPVPPPPPQNVEGTRSPVAELHKMWEKRTTSWDKNAKDPGPNPQGEQNAEWKSFLAKKVQAEAAASAPKEGGGDSVFDFDEHGQKVPRSAFDDLSELSPIRHDESDSEYGTRASEVVSEASTSVVQGTTFLQRLQACAAPVVTKGKQFAEKQNCSSESPITSHLAFLKNTPGGKSGILQASAGLCGKPDTISEVGEDGSTVESLQTTPTNASSLRLNKERSRSNPRAKQQKDDMSSVVSDGFGAQSAYLEAIAMKAATGGKKKKKKPSSEASAASGTPKSEASAKSGHSEKFQQFLDRRASRDTAASVEENNNNDNNKDVSSRAEKYASEKVNEMMDSMADRDNRETGAFPSATTKQNDASRVAAEELAAARVEVMMQTLSSQNLEDNEVEI